MITDTLSPENLLKIGEVASVSGIPIKTIRYYDDLGLLGNSITRNQAGYRLFDSSIFNRLSFIKRSQSLGLSLKEIENILSIYDKGEIPCGVAKDVLLERLDNIEQQIEQLQILQTELKAILSGWKFADKLDGSICPNIQPPIN
ncbi:transcriptional regulator, MerR family [Cyanobacterium stanieri PCC 7202]|uniref:Transcriptional regulator, MerR family n=1 Tax=Cyanobacterium stanieri (strain ATCC 29140 / PCC 7202) TaxID=292563 RepID=K9YP18_CYASC|nr:transcriptional regulator, MerR family [Cyanobacterium stanieri PCC 7202]